MLSRRAVLPVIVFSQFAGTSLWFAVNAVITDIRPGPEGANVATLTTVIQLGFIAGTFLFALFGIADRFRASTVFLLSSIIASGSNLLVLWLANDTSSLCMLRFTTGFFLAGIYPVGMKIAATQFPGKMGNALGFLVGALVLGTAFPHLVRASLGTISWRWVLAATSALAVSGGILMRVLVPGQKPLSHGVRFDPGALSTVFKSAAFRAAAGGYFGHMWELYAFWAFVPALIALYNRQSGATLPVPAWSFVIIALGFLSCIAGGRISQVTGSRKVAAASLFLSGLLCLMSPLMFWLPAPAFLFLACLWGASVIADSPQFSALVAQTAPSAQVGTALTFVTSIGFAITIASIQLLQAVRGPAGIYTFLFLLPGPIIGLLAMRRLRK